MHFYKKYYYHLLLSLIFFFCVATHSARAQDSIISRIQYIIPCIVEITVKNAIMIQMPEGSFVDKKDEQLTQVNGLKAVEYTRQGSGVIIHPNGIIVTNAHIVADGAKVEVRFHDGASVNAKILKVIPQRDLAFLLVNPPYPVSRIDMIDSTHIKINDEVVTVGSSPFLKQTISGGRITGLAQHRNNPYDVIDPDLFEININIYQGDSGGPLFNKKGQMIGLMVAKQINQDRLCYAITSNKIIQAYIELLNELNPQK